MLQSMLNNMVNKTQNTSETENPQEEKPETDENSADINGLLTELIGKGEE